MNESAKLFWFLFYCFYIINCLQLKDIRRFFVILHFEQHDLPWLKMRKSQKRLKGTTKYLKLVIPNKTFLRHFYSIWRPQESIFNDRKKIEFAFLLRLRFFSLRMMHSVKTLLAFPFVQWQTWRFIGFTSFPTLLHKTRNCILTLFIEQHSSMLLNV